MAWEIAAAILISINVVVLTLIATSLKEGMNVEQTALYYLISIFLWANTVLAVNIATDNAGTTDIITVVLDKISMIYTLLFFAITCYFGVVLIKATLNYAKSKNEEEKFLKTLV